MRVYGKRSTCAHAHQACTASLARAQQAHAKFMRDHQMVKRDCAQPRVHRAHQVSTCIKNAKCTCADQGHEMCNVASIAQSACAQQAHEVCVYTSRSTGPVAFINTSTTCARAHQALKVCACTSSLHSVRGQNNHRKLCNHNSARSACTSQVCAVWARA